ncbi:uncharacterized protein LOC142227936 isoform X2 [Haematobia irritans]|uniref:uncharacterized protein LOC142227936 isoform X2 n=1 Tax=Haematobia irritans TaxID=7368 RepID=UPI003F506CA5
MFSNMKILTPNSQENMPLSSLSPTASQKPVGQTVGNRDSTSKDFVNVNHGASVQKPNKRDQYQKHNNGPNKTKFIHANGNGSSSNKMPQHQQSKYHHNSNVGNKNKKQHYISNSNSTSSLNRKKFYQQQNTLQPFHYHNQQHQYLSTMHTSQQKAQTTTNNGNNNNATSNNNNCHLVKNQNYSSSELQKNNVGNNNNTTIIITNTTIPQSDTSISSIISSDSPCKCSSNQAHKCGKLSPTVALQKYTPILHRTNSNEDCSNTPATSSSLIPNVKSTSGSKTEAISSSCGACYTKFGRQQSHANMKINSKNKTDNSSYRQKSFESDQLCKCNNGSSFTMGHSGSLHSAASTTFQTGSNSKKKSWKNSNNLCCTGCSCTGGGICTSCSSSAKPQVDKVIPSEILGTKRCECNCIDLSFGDNNPPQRTQNKNDNFQSIVMGKGISCNESTEQRTSLHIPPTPSANDIPSNSDIEKSLLSSTPVVKGQFSGSSNSTEVTSFKHESSGSTLADSPIAKRSSSSGESNRNNILNTQDSTTKNITSSNSYSLDFLHSVGVQMAGGIKHDVTNKTENLMGPITSGTSSYNSQCTENSPARSAYSYSNQRNPRYMNEGGGNNQQSYHHHHHHHQPTQLTIASFLQKDLLGESILPSSKSSGNSANNSNLNSNAQSSNTYNEPQSYVRSNQNSRYYNNYYPPQYHQQQSSVNASCYSTSTGINQGGAADLSRFTSNSRAVYGNYLNYHINSANTTNGGALQQYPNHILTGSQDSSRATRILQSNCVTLSGDCDSTSKKNSHGSTSSTSSSCSSSNSSTGVNSTSVHSRKQTHLSAQNSSKSISHQTSAIETLPSKINNQYGGNQRQGQHRGGHHGGHHAHSHHHHHQHHNQSHYSHHSHVIAHNTPSTPQHQNYYNLTYVSTDGNIGGANSRGCSPAPTLPPTPSSSNPSPKPLEKISQPIPAGMMANIQRYSLGSSTSYQHYQPNQFLNKKLLAPLSLSVPSPSPSPTPSHMSGTPMTIQPPALVPPNIICCSQLDEATTAAAAAAAKTGIIAGNDYDSDASSTHSLALSNPLQHRKYQQSCRSQSLSTSSSVTSLCSSSKQLPVECKSQPGTPVDVSAATTPLGSPIDFTTYAPSLVHSFPNMHISSTTSGGTQFQQNYFANQVQHGPKANTQHAQTAHVYPNMVSFLNIPNQSSNGGEGSTSTTYLEEDYQQHQQHNSFLPTASSNQSSVEQLNLATLSSGSSRSNSSSGYWSPSHQCSFYNQLPSTVQSMNNLILPNNTSCGSSSSSISPVLPDREDMKQQSQSQQHQNSQFASSASTSPSPCSCKNEKVLTSESYALSATTTSSLSTSTSLSGSTLARSYEKGSTQLLPQQQQRLIAQQSSSPTLSLPGNTSYSLPTAQRSVRGTGNGRSQYLQNNSTLLASSTTNSNQQTTMIPHIFSHQQMQSLPPPPPPHNLLYHNPQVQHMRQLNNPSVHDFFTHTPPDRFLAKAHLIEAKEAPASLLNNSKWDNLSRDIWAKFISSQQTEETFRKKMRLWRYLYLFIKNAYPRYGLYLVGSTISGFGSDTSDVDMCLVSRSASNIDPRVEALFNLTVLQECLSKSEFECFHLIEAKVPILRFRDRVHQLEVDLNFNNCVGIKNTHLLHCYSQMDWRLRPLVLVIKLWAQHHNINNAKNMTISSYSLVLMVIHFLQYAANPPVLPCLHQMFPDKFPFLRSNDFGYVDMNETMGPYESENNQTIGELFLDFLEYYSNFDYSQNAISVRTGGILPINVCRTAKSLKNDIHQWKELCIEEPFDLTNTARSVYDFETFERVKGVFISSWQVLKDSLDLNSVFMPVFEPGLHQTTPIANADFSIKNEGRIHSSTSLNESRALAPSEDLTTNKMGSSSKHDIKQAQTNLYHGVMYELKTPAGGGDMSKSSSSLLNVTPSTTSTPFCGKPVNRSNNKTALLS